MLPLLFIGHDRWIFSRAVDTGPVKHEPNESAKLPWALSTRPVTTRIITSKLICIFYEFIHNFH